VSVPIGWVCAAVFGVVVADLVTGTAAVGLALCGTSWLRLFLGACIMRGYTLLELGHLEAVSGGTPTYWLVYSAAYSLVGEYNTEYPDTLPWE
jgi:hypothetical protein